MTSPSPNPTVEARLEILDLRHFTGRQLRALLEEEAVVWNERLRWDYRSSTELLIQYLDSQILPGFVALRRGKVVGFCFCVYEGAKAVIGDVYVAIDTPVRMAVTEMLVRHLLEVLEASPEVDRIEAQLLLFDPGTLSAAFKADGFQVFPRLFLEAALTPELPPSEGLPAPGSAKGAGLELCRWNPALYHQTAEMIHAAYEGHVDSEINDQYRTLGGSLRFLHNIVRFPGCGTFDQESSWVLRDRGSGALAGVLLCSRLEAEVAHVTQLCLDPRFRGQGLGGGLLRHTMAGLYGRGYRVLTLTVSEANHAALKLYRAAGFRTRLAFEALVLDKTVAPERFRIVAPAAEDTAPANASGGGGLFAFARRKATLTRRSR